MEAILRRHLVRTAATAMALGVVSVCQMAIMAIGVTATAISNEIPAYSQILYPLALSYSLYMTLSLYIIYRYGSLLKHVWDISASLGYNPFMAGYIRRERIGPPLPSNNHHNTVNLIPTSRTKFNLICLPPEIRTFIFRKHLEGYQLYCPVSQLQDLDSLVSRIIFFEGLKSNTKLRDETIDTVLKSLPYALNSSTF
ncbi:hypothetical protein DL98DRAFT_532351 [Cadophora sp. DSE1049]|nr:hypothetical protein DL98DRAFT_532351 [Cadophora sp. DSE1049]